VRARFVLTDPGSAVKLPPDVPDRAVEGCPGASPRMTRPITVPRWAAFLFLLGLYLTVRGYHSRDGDQAYRLPLLIHQQDPTRYADDPFVRAVDAFNPHRGYLTLLDMASRPLGLSAALFGLFAATFALTCGGVARLARSVAPLAGPMVGPIAVALVLLAKAGNVGTNHLFEAMLLDRLIGFSFGWAALALAIEGETWRPSLLIGLAAVVHPSVGLQLGGLVGASWGAWSVAGGRAGWTWRRSAIGLGTLLLAIAPGTAGMLGQGGRLFAGLSADEFRRVGVELQMAQHMVPSLWRAPQWLAWGAYIALAAVAIAGWFRGRAAEGGSFARARFAILFGTLMAGLGAAYLAIEVVGSLSVTVFQPFRMATVARGLALIALAGRCAGLWSRGDPGGKARVLILAAGLGGDWAFVVAAAIELTATLADWAGARLGRPMRVPVHLLPGLALVGGVGFLARHDTESGHRPLLVAALAAVVVASLGPRLRPGWTRARLALAVAACGSVPIAALVASTLGRADSPAVRALAARCRFVEVATDDVEALALWCRDHTPEDARFITPPGPKTFRLWSGRSVAFNRAASPYHAEGLKDWAGRFRAHVGFVGTTPEFARAYLADRHGIEARYGRLTPEALADLARSQGAGYVLAAAPPSGNNNLGPLKLLRGEGRYAVYKIELEQRVVTADDADLRR